METPVLIPMCCLEQKTFPWYAGLGAKLIMVQSFYSCLSGGTSDMSSWFLFPSAPQNLFNMAHKKHQGFLKKSGQKLSAPQTSPDINFQ